MPTPRHAPDRRWIALALLLAACGGGGDAGAVASADAEVRDPCTLLGTELLATRFELTDTDLTWRSSGSSPQPLCTASWPRPDAADIERRMAEEMTERMATRLRGEEAGPLTLRTTNEVSLAIRAPRAGTAEEAAAGFESVVRALADGGVAGVGGREVPDFPYDSESVEGVADRAVWVEGLSQVSVVSGRSIFHVTVQVDDDPAVNRGHAVALARALARHLN